MLSRVRAREGFMECEEVPAPARSRRQNGFQAMPPTFPVAAIVPIALSGRLGGVSDTFNPRARGFTYSQRARAREVFGAQRPAALPQE